MKWLTRLSNEGQRRERLRPRAKTRRRVVNQRVCEVLMAVRTLAPLHYVCQFRQNTFEISAVIDAFVVHMPKCTYTQRTPRLCRICLGVGPSKRADAGLFLEFDMIFQLLSASRYLKWSRYSTLSCRVPLWTDTMIAVTGVLVWCGYLTHWSIPRVSQCQGKTPRTRVAGLLDGRTAKLFLEIDTRYNQEYPKYQIGW